MTTWRVIGIIVLAHLTESKCCQYTCDKTVRFM